MIQQLMWWEICQEFTSRICSLSALGNTPDLGQRIEEILFMRDVLRDLYLDKNKGKREKVK